MKLTIPVGWVDMKAILWLAYSNKKVKGCSRKRHCVLCLCVCEREREREQQSGIQGSALNVKLSCITFILRKGSESEFHLFPMDINGLSGRCESI